MFLTALILLTLPYAPAVWNRLNTELASVMRHSELAFLLGVGLAATSFLYARRRQLSRSGWLLLVAVALGYLVSFFAFGPPIYGSPLTSGEKTHFVSYGIMALLYYRALTLDVPPGWSYVGAFGIVSAVGLLDEGLQYLLPSRVFEWKDVWINMTSALLAVGAIRGVEPASDRPETRC